jgi:hypothetical protein
MKTKYYFIILLLLQVTKLYSQQKLYLRPSVGPSKSFPNKNFVERNSTNTSSTYLQFGKTINLLTNPISEALFSLPQSGLMLEYKPNKRHTIGIGFMRGKLEGKSIAVINNFRRSWSSKSGLYIKKGLEYTYTFTLNEIVCKKSNLAKKINISLLGGVFLVDNSRTNYDIPVRYKTLLDANKNVTDSFYSNASLLNEKGYMLSTGIRTFLTGKKNREPFTLTLLFYFGFTDLASFETANYYNYKNNFIKGRQVSNGSQVKIYISKPICLNKPINYIARKFKK